MKKPSAYSLSHAVKPLFSRAYWLRQQPVSVFIRAKTVFTVSACVADGGIALLSYVLAEIAEKKVPSLAP